MLRRALVVAIWLWTSQAQAAPITYIVHREIGAATVDGWITTDGTIGRWLDSAPIKDFSLDMVHGEFFVHYDVTDYPNIPTGANMVGVSASSTDLMFDATLNNAFFHIGNWHLGQAWPDPRISYEMGPSASVQRPGRYVFASVPEPATWLLLSMGLLALSARRNSR